MINLSAPDFTQHPPRSTRVRLGGYAHLPRAIDKARAANSGKQGEFNFNCPVDQQFFRFTGIDAEAFRAEVKLGRTDVEILAWVSARDKHLPHEIVAWSSWFEQNGPGGAGDHEWIGGAIKATGSTRSDIHSFADLLDLDDYLSFGGKA